MKQVPLSLRNLANWAKLLVKTIFVITVSAMCFLLRADEITVPIGNAPALFLPSIPSLEPDDSSIDYYYLISGTGAWEESYDPPGEGDIYMWKYASSMEKIVRNKTTGGSVNSSRSAGFAAELDSHYCQSMYLTFLSTNQCDSTNDLECTFQEPWFTYTYPYPSTTGNTAYEFTDGLPSGSFPGEFDISTGPFTNSVSCGTVTTGASWFHSVFAKGWPGCDPGPVYELGQGGFYEIQLTISPGCEPVNLPGPAIPTPMATTIVTSGDPKTPSAGHFDGSSSFDFSFIGDSNSVYEVYESSNLLNWSLAGSVDLGIDTTNGAFSDTNVAGATERFYMVMDTNGDYSAPYGFINLSLSNGYHMIGDPLFNGSAEITNIFQEVPEGTTLSFWAVTNWGPTSTFASGNWDTNAILVPGEAALIYLPTNTTLTFVGEVIQDTITNGIPDGISAMSSPEPQAGSITSLGFPSLGNGDTVQRLIGTNYVVYTNVSGTWSPSTPSLGLCEGILVNSSTNTAWSMYVQTALYAQFVTTSGGSDNAAYSPDGIHWYASPTGLPSNDQWTALAYGNGVYTALSTSGDTNAAYSLDGINWSASPTGLPGGAGPGIGQPVCFAGSFLAMTGDGQIDLSDDGINWSTTNFLGQTLTLPFDDSYGIAADPSGEYFVVTPFVDSGSAVSYTGCQAWHYAALSYGVWAGVYGDKFVIVSPPNQVAHSSDGGSWTTNALPFSGTWSGITYGGGMYVAVASGTNQVAHSTDGSSWSTATMPFNDNWQNVAYGSGKFVAVANGSTNAAYSTDGIHWNPAVLPFADYWGAIAAKQ